MTRPIPILLYHGVDPDPPAALGSFVIRPDRFAEHMALLAERGFTALTVSGLCDLIDLGGPLPDDLVLVTFDDGLADFGRHAWPIVRDAGLVATLYVVSGYVGQHADWLTPFGAPPAMLDWDEVAALDADGCEIGAHSVTHPELDTLGSAELVDQVRSSRAQLGSRLGHPIRSFAYPHGYHGPKVKAVTAKAGYDSACAVRNMLSSTDDDRFALARVTIGADCDVAELGRILDGAHLPVAPRREQLRTKGWRAYRRTRRRFESSRVPA